MNQGVEILLARMDSNPDEFTTARGKWDWVMDGVNRRVADKDKESDPHLPYLNDEEVKALWDKFNTLRRDSFTHRVMETLLEDAQELPTTGISRAEMLKELVPGLNALFGTEYDKYNKEEK